MDAQKLKLFPATLKECNTPLVHGTWGKNIHTWDEMKQVFLRKYQDYYKARDLVKKYLR
jgi:hypothetical protein